MAVNILTPISIWKDMYLPSVVTSVPISEVVENGIVKKRFFIDGRKTDQGQVEIFATIVKKQSVDKAPAILMLKEFENDSILPSMTEIAKEGYIAFTVDIEGKNKSGEYSTIYPEDINYANYSIAKENLTTLLRTAKESCYYEWAYVLKYAIWYLHGCDFVTKIGVIGSGINVTSLWQAVAFNEVVSAFVPIFNIGWKFYKGHYKFDNEPEIIFPDEELSFIAGIEPQSYASYVKCPTFAICNSNDILFDSDRAHDTIKRVDNDVKGIYYENKCLHGLTNEAINTIKAFFYKTLKCEEKVDFIEPNISSKISNGEITVTVDTLDSAVKSVSLYASEEQIKTEFRNYIRIDKCKTKGSAFIFKYVPFNKSKRVIFFATATLQDGSFISTNIEAVEFKEEDFSSNFSNQVFYSSREEGAENIFASKNKIRFNEIFNSKKDILPVKTGAQGIKGLSIKSGIISFAIQNVKYKPAFDSILMFDLFSVEAGEVFVKCYLDYYGDRKEYSCCIKLSPSKAWVNNKIDFSRFKTEEGFSLKESDEIEAIEFYCDKDVLINNILWI